MSERWTIQQLSTLVEQVLAAADYGGQQSGRVREVPDLRTIRYYTTLGLLDKPVEMRGRRAFYCGRHALQLAAIKRLQARGLSLVELQQAMSGADDKQLHGWVGLPHGVWKQIVKVVAAQCEDRSPDALLSLASRETPTRGSVRASRDRFWASAPAEPSDAVQEQTAASPPQSTCLAYPAVHLSILPNVKLVIEEVAWANLGAAQRTDLAQAMGDLAATLDRLGLGRPNSITGITAKEHRRFNTQSE